MDYNNLLQNLKKEHFPELKNISVDLKTSRMLGKAFMITLPFTTNIYYNKKIIKRCNGLSLKAVFIHELYHIVQFKKMNNLQKLIFLPRYHIFDKYRINHELDCHREVVKRGFGKELLELNKFVKERYPKEIWNKKISNYYLSEEEIKNNLKNKTVKEL